jgi:hypothetical protein
VRCALCRSVLCGCDACGCDVTRVERMGVCGHGTSWHPASTSQVWSSFGSVTSLFTALCTSLLRAPGSPSERESVGGASEYSNSPAVTGTVTRRGYGPGVTKGSAVGPGGLPIASGDSSVRGILATRAGGCALPAAQVIFIHSRSFHAFACVEGSPDLHSLCAARRLPHVATALAHLKCTRRRSSRSPLPVLHPLSRWCAGHRTRPDPLRDGPPPLPVPRAA